MAEPADPLGPVARAAAAGDLRAMLVGMQARIARDIDNPDTSAREIAALTKRLREVTDEIAAIDAQKDDNSDSVAAAAATPDEAYDGASS